MLLLALLIGGYVLYVLAHDNFHVVSAGRVYRSSQMSGAALSCTIQEHGNKTVINLRGESPDVEWYRSETNVTHQLGVQHLDFALSAGRDVSDREIEDIMDWIRRAPKPVLIHCNGGADRTALISSLYLYRLEGKTAADASRELNMFYGHIPHLHWRYSRAMDRSYWRYVSNHLSQVGTNSTPTSKR